MNNIKIRKANIFDLNDIARLLYQVHELHNIVRPDLFKKVARKYEDDELIDIINNYDKPIFVAAINDIICGYAFCFVSTTNKKSLVSNKTLYIDDLCVDKNYRGMHIGTELYNYVLKYAKEIDCYNLTLNVWADNINAVKFYESLGLKKQKITLENILKED